MSTYDRRKPRPRPGRGGKSSLLERCVQALHLRYFHIFANNPEFERAVVIPPRYVIRGYPHPTLYGTRGFKEAVIFSPPTIRLFVPVDGRSISVGVEAKYQEGSGSVDEKFPYVYHTCLESEIPNWIVIAEGPWWKQPRGLAALTWLKAQPVPVDRRLYVVDHKGFIALVDEAWK